MTKPKAKPVQRSSIASSTGNVSDIQYHQFLEKFDKTFRLHVTDAVLFTTNTDPDAMWDAYLKAFKPSQRQHHNCSSCRHFIKRYAGLVLIQDDGRTVPALSVKIDLPEYSAAFEAVFKLVRKAKITGVFYSKEVVLGEPLTGIWRHMAVTLPTAMVHTSRAQTAFQAMAEKSEDYKNISRALAEFSKSNLELTLKLLETDSLYRSEKVLGPAQFLHALHISREGALVKSNVVWKAVALAPSGFCHRPMRSLKRFSIKRRR